jgi:hypothetical protein
LRVRRHSGFLRLVAGRALHSSDTLEGCRNRVLDLREIVRLPDDFERVRIASHGFVESLPVRGSENHTAPLQSRDHPGAW